MAQDFELVEHTADIKIRVFGATLEELFIHALKGMFQSIKPKVSGCSYINDRLVCSQLPKKHTIELSSHDKESLLVDFLSEALYLSDTHNEAYLDGTIYELSDTHIKAEIRGVEVQGFEVVEIKAVTYYNLKITKVEGLWTVEVVFDI